MAIHFKREATEILTTETQSFYSFQFSLPRPKVADQARDNTELEWTISSRDLVGKEMKHLQKTGRWLWTYGIAALKST